MRKVLPAAPLLGAAFVLALAAAEGQAQTVNICDRTPQVASTLLRVLEADDCAAVDSAAMAGLVGLDLSIQEIASLQAGDFDNLTSLQWLSFRHNQLTALPAGLFDGLTSLQYLHLGTNQLTALPNGSFDNLTSLRYLHLGTNQLTALPEGLFGNLSSLQYLYLNHIPLTALSGSLFDNLTSLEHLFLHDTQLSALPEGLFDNLTNLRELGLSDNHLVGLTRDSPLFAGLPEGAVVSLDMQTAPPEQPEQPETPEQPEQPERPPTPSDDGLAAKIAALEISTATPETSTESQATSPEVLEDSMAAATQAQDMTVLIILGYLTIFAAIVFSYKAVEGHAIRNYGYNPFSIGNLSFMLIPIALFVGATFFLGPQETLIEALKKGNLNVILMVALSAVSLGLFAYRLSIKTNFFIAIFATALLLAAAVVIILLWVLREIFKGKKRRARKRRW